MFLHSFLKTTFIIFLQYFHKKSFVIKIDTDFNLNILFVRTGFDLNPKLERTQAHVAQTINLSSAGKKASLISGQDIGF